MPKRKRQPRVKSTRSIWQHFSSSLLIVLIFFVAIDVIERGNFFTRSQPAPPADISGDAFGEFANTGAVHSALISGYVEGERFENMLVNYVLIDGLPIFEGDIILDLRNPITQSGVGLPDVSFYWPNGLVPYEIDPRLPAQYRITQSIQHWEEKTSIRFVERTSRNASEYPNYVYFQPSMGCSSYVGMIGGRQPINLGIGCSVGNTIHEIGHAIGLWHEQSRHDRDEHVTIHFENIQPGMEFNFNKRSTDGEDMGEYDYDSIMHYPRWAFSKNGKDTIVPHGDQIIGQRSSLSEGDIAAVEYMYSRNR